MYQAVKDVREHCKVIMKSSLATMLDSVGSGPQQCAEKALDTPSPLRWYYDEQKMAWEKELSDQFRKDTVGWGAGGKVVGMSTSW